MKRDYLKIILLPQLYIIIGILLIFTAMILEIFTLPADVDKVARYGFLFFVFGIVIVLGSSFYEQNHNFFLFIIKGSKKMILEVRKKLSL